MNRPVAVSLFVFELQIARDRIIHFVAVRISSRTIGFYYMIRGPLRKAKTFSGDIPQQLSIHFYCNHYGQRQGNRQLELICLNNKKETFLIRKSIRKGDLIGNVSH